MVSQQAIRVTVSALSSSPFERFVVCLSAARCMPSSFKNIHQQPHCAHARVYAHPTDLHVPNVYIKATESKKKDKERVRAAESAKEKAEKRLMESLQVIRAHEDDTKELRRKVKSHADAVEQLKAQVKVIG